MSPALSNIFHQNNLIKSRTQFFAGLDWILQSHANRSTQPDFVASIVSMSISFSSVLDNVDTAVTELAAAGIHVSVRLRSPPLFLPHH